MAVQGQNAGRLNLADHQEIDMRTIDFTPLYRSAVGFDRLAGLLESAARAGQETGWPPYNIETTGENTYRIEIAVAGFKPDELTLEVKESLLTVTGRKTANDDAGANRTYLHRGLAERDFERRFQLADYVVVTDAGLDNGLLAIRLKRELPEALKPRRIEIATGTAKPLIKGEAA
jgi:molecular chaperone IbpA